MNSWELPEHGGGLEEICRSGVIARDKEETGTYQNAEYPQGLVYDMCHTAELMLQLQCWNSGHLFSISAALSRDPGYILLRSGLC